MSLPENHVGPDTSRMTRGPLVRPRIALVGNAGSGKTTLARGLARVLRIARLELDDLVWHRDRRRHLVAPPAVAAALDGFVAAHSEAGWVVEGVYTRWIARALRRRRGEQLLVWLDLDAELCAARVRARALPRAGFKSDAEREQRRQFVERWAASYGSRTDADSRAGHAALFDGHEGAKLRLSRAEAAPEGHLARVVALLCDIRRRG